MTNEEIKKEANKCYEQIKIAQGRLKEIRKICKHEKTFHGNYLFRECFIEPGEICEYCGELINY